MVYRMLVLLLLQCGACSFVGVIRGRSGGVENCTASPTLPIIDTVFFAAAATGVIASAIAAGDCPTGENIDAPCPGVLGAFASTLVMVPYGISAGYGYAAVIDCREQRDREREETLAAKRSRQTHEQAVYRDCASRRRDQYAQVMAEPDAARRKADMAAIPACTLVPDSVENRAWTATINAADQALRGDCAAAATAADIVFALDRAQYDRFVAANSDIAACTARLRALCLQRRAEVEQRALLLPIAEREAVLRTQPSCRAAD